MFIKKLPLHDGYDYGMQSDYTGYYDYIPISAKATSFFDMARKNLLQVLYHQEIELCLF